MDQEFIIPDHEITFLIQGPEHFAIKKSIENIKNIFPASKIILSSTSDYKEIYPASDLTIVSEDPGAIPFSTYKNSRLNNTNRQIVSTHEGLKYVSTRLVFKLRSDFILQGNHFLRYFGKYPKFLDNYQIFSNKILACSFFSRNPESYHPFPFHISDLVFFGLTLDIKKLYDVPLMNEQDQRFILDKDIIRNRFHPEQHILLNCLKKSNFNYHCNYYNFTTQENIIETERIFASNFILLNFEQFSLLPTKDTFNQKMNPIYFASCYTHNEWKYLYKKNCDENLLFSKRDKEREILNRNLYLFYIFVYFTKYFSFIFPFSKMRKASRKKMYKFFNYVFN